MEIQNSTNWQTLEMSSEDFRKARSRYRRRALLPVVGFLGPFIFLWSIFLAAPMIWSIWLSFNTGGLIDEAKFVGMDNWARMFAN
jgi:ABC-type sugar transport system permease subunit